MFRSSLSIGAGIFLSGCACMPASDASGGARLDLDADIRNYCWSDKQFANVDFARASFIQLVNDDMVMYRLSDEPERMYCAYPVDGETYKKMALEKGIKFSEYRVVVP